MFMKSRESFHPYAMITILFWSLAFVLTRLALQHFTAFSLGFLRYFVASSALIVVAIATKMKMPRRQDILWFAASGAVGFFFYMIAFNKGVETVTASTSSVIIATVPVITALLARLVYREKLKGYQWGAIFLEFLGVAVLTVMNGGFSVNVGLLWLFLAALALSAYNLLQRRLTKAYTALQTSAYSIFFGAAMLAVFLPGSLGELRNAPGIQLFYLLILGVFSSAAAYLTWSVAFAKAERTSQVSNYMFLTPFLTGILGFFMANELPDAATLAGGSMILVGVLLFNFGGRISES